MHAGVKLEFPYGSIVSINGRDLNEFNFKNHQDAPTFYGIVENPDQWDDREAEETQEGESFVRFLLSGEYEFFDKKTRT